MIFSTEPVPGLGIPVGGGGVRVHGMMKALAARGHEVILSLPKAVVDQLQNPPTWVKDSAHTPDSAKSLITRLLPDVLIYEQWTLTAWVGDVPLPTVIDIPGPLILENLYRGHGNFSQNVIAKVQALSMADLFLVSSAAQKKYHVPWLLMAGVDYRNIPVEIAPVGFDPQLPERHPSKEPTFFYGGLLWPWQDPHLALKTTLDLLEKRNHGLLRVIVGSHSTNIGFDARSRYTKSMPTLSRGEFLSKIGSSGRLLASDLLNFEELVTELCASTAAIDVMTTNSERELAFPTRTVTYLWAGLPVIHPKNTELAPLIEEYNAGWLVDPDDAEQIRAAAVEVIENHRETERRAEGAAKLARERFTWDITYHRLIKFVEAPVKRKRDKSPIIELLSHDRFDRLLGRFDSLLGIYETEMDKHRALSLETHRELALELAELTTSSQLVKSRLETQRTEVENLEKELARIEDSIARISGILSAEKKSLDSDEQNG
ncbi:MAG: hypothetical protein NUW37_08275 [Planctomycetes bacterium]|nr:hypothetical protein [Planctomycetota bacterium]